MFKIYRNLFSFGQKENFGKANEVCQNYHVLEVCLFRRAKNNMAIDD